MKTAVRLNKRGLPRAFMAKHPAARGLVAEGDVFVHRHGRLAAKVVVFDHATTLVAFWEKAFGHGNPKGTLGVVQTLARQVTETDRAGRPIRRWLECDPRYFCVIGLCLGWLSANIVTHECVHAAFSYEKRVGRNLFGEAASFDEERICYPAGIIAQAVNDFLYRHNLYDRKPNPPKKRRRVAKRAKR